MSSADTQVKYADSKLITVIRWFAWISSSMISALINVWFISQLASHFYESIIFAIVAIVLECGKLTAVLRANIFSSLYKKVGGSSIVRKRNSSYVVYAMYAVFAIICATAFSVNMTTTSVSSYDTQIELLQAQRESIVALRDPTQVSSELTLAKQRYDDLQDLYLVVNREDDDLQYAYRTKALKSDGSSYTWADSNASTQKLRSVRNDRDEAQARWESLQRDHDEAELLRRATLAEAESKYGSVLDIDNQMGQLRINKAMNAGSAQIFITMGDLFGFDPNTFRLILLIFLSFLVEYIVFSLAPTSKVNRKLLYDYREFIPQEKVVKILEEFDQEIDLYLGSKRPDKLEEKLHAAELTIEKLVEKNEPEPAVKPKRKPGPKPGPKPGNKAKKKPGPKPKKVEAPPIEVIPEPPPLVEASSGLTVELVPEPPQVLKEIEVHEQPIKESKETESQTKLYRYGRSNEKILEKFKDFMEVILPNSPGPFVISPDDGARMAGISTRLKDTFIKRLSSLMLQDQSLIYLDQDTDRWSSTASKSEVISYSTELIENS